MDGTSETDLAKDAGYIAMLINIIDFLTILKGLFLRFSKRQVDSVKFT